MAVLAPHPVKNIDLAPAKEWGRLVFANPGRYVFADELGPDDTIPNGVAESLRLAASRFDPRTDFLLLVGDHVQLTFLACLISGMHGEFRVLRYDRIAKGYFAVKSISMFSPAQVAAD